MGPSHLQVHRHAAGGRATGEPTGAGGGGACTPPRGGGCWCGRRGGGAPLASVALSREAGAVCSLCVGPRVLVPAPAPAPPLSPWGRTMDAE